MLSQTQTHCIHPLHRSTETKAVFLSLSYWIVLASGQNCVQRVHFVFPQISVSMFATRYIQPPYAVVEAAEVNFPMTQPFVMAYSQPALTEAIFFSINSCLCLNFRSTTESRAAVPPETTKPFPKNRSFTALSKASMLVSCVIAEMQPTMAILVARSVPAVSIAIRVAGKV